MTDYRSLILSAIEGHPKMLFIEATFKNFNVTFPEFAAVLDRNAIAKRLWSDDTAKPVSGVVTLGLHQERGDRWPNIHIYFDAEMCRWKNPESGAILANSRDLADFIANEILTHRG